MTYVIFVYDRNEDRTMYSARVPAGDATYLRRVCTTLAPLSEDDYVNGPAVILGTAAQYSYVVVGEDVLWCIEWQPGLIVIRFSPYGEFAWTSVRSKVPNFGGRPAPQSEIDAYAEDFPDPQYNLIFDPWDAQFDEDQRNSMEFAAANTEIAAVFQAALNRVNGLQESIEQLRNNPSWRDRCVNNLESWCGNGASIK